MDNKILPHEKELRARLLPYNEGFKQDVIDTRQKLGLPNNGLDSVAKAVRWRVKHFTAYGATRYICVECGNETNQPGICHGQQMVSPWYQRSLDDPTKADWVRQQEFWSFEPYTKDRY